MGNRLVAWCGSVGCLVYASGAMASTSGNASSDGALGGFLLVLGFVLLAYLFVFLVRHLNGRMNKGPAKISAYEFDKLTTPSDRPMEDRN